MCVCECEGNMIDPEKLRRCLKINDTKIDYELKRQPELIYWLGQNIADLEKTIAIEKEQFENLEARIAFKKRKEYLADGVKLTEKALTEVIALSKRIRAGKVKLIELNKAHKVLLSAQSALVSKGKSLEQISFNRRKEIDFNIRKQATKDRINNRGQS